jgi:RNA polymerase sigma-70 factor (ECF subfamily)
VDREVVARARDGDREAYSRLVHDRIDRLYAIAYRILRNVELSQDAIQESLVLAWRDLPGLRDVDRFDAWLQRLVVRECVREAVRARRHDIARLDLGRGDVSRPGDDFVMVADRDRLERGFRRLDPDQRAIVVLRHYAGFEPTEIAELLGIPAGTARSRLHHAYRAMRAAIDADERVAAIGGQPA